MQISKFRPYYKLWKSVNGQERYNDIFKGTYRIYLDFKTTENEIVNKSKVQIEIEKFLANNGYTVKDYKNGIAVKSDTDKIIKIGKLLNRFNFLKNEFDSDIVRDGAKLNDLKVVISKHPYDIVNMSTERGWTSCMNLNGGTNTKYIKNDIIEGTLIAYLIKNSDLNIKNPIARILIKPFVKNDNSSTTLIVEDRVYGTDKKGFKETINKWLATFQNNDNGSYRLNDNLYKDGLVSVLILNNTPYRIYQQYDNYAIILEYKDNSYKYGIIDVNNGNTILNINYNYVQLISTSEDFNIFKVDYKTLVINKKTNEYNIIDISSSNNFKDDLNNIYLIYAKGYRYGVVNIHGEILINHTYTEIRPINNHLLTNKNNKYGLISCNNEIIVDCICDRITYDSKYFYFHKDDTIKFYNISEKKIVYETNKLYKKISNVAKDLFLVSDGKMSCIDISGNFILKDLLSITQFNENFLIVCKFVEHNKMVYAIYDVINHVYVNEFIYQNIFRFNNEYIGCLKLNNTFELFNLKGESVYDHGWENFSYLDTSNINCDIIYIVNKNQHKLFNLKTGEYLFEDKHITKINYTHDRNIIYCNKIKGKNYYGLIRNDGTELIPSIYDSINSFNGGYQIKLEGELYGYYDSAYNMILEPKYILKEFNIMLEKTLMIEPEIVHVRAGVGMLQYL